MKQKRNNLQGNGCSVRILVKKIVEKLMITSHFIKFVAAHNISCFLLLLSGSIEIDGKFIAKNRRECRFFEK